MQCSACGKDLDETGSCPACGKRIKTGNGNGAPAARKRNGGNALARWWRGLTGGGKLAMLGVGCLVVAMVVGSVLAGALGSGTASYKPKPKPPKVKPGTPMLEQFFRLRASVLSIQLDSVLYQANLKNTEAARRLLGVSFTGTVGTAPARPWTPLLSDARGELLSDGGLEENNDANAVRYCNEVATEFTPAYRELEAQATSLRAAAATMRTPSNQAGTRDTLVEANALAQQSLAQSLSAMALLTQTDPIKLTQARTALDDANALIEQSRAMLDRTKASLGEK